MRTLLLAALAVLAGCSVSPPPPRQPAPKAEAPRQTPPAVARTSVRAFEPAAIVGPEQNGECWTGSIAVARSGAYRCNVGNGILDPCFALPRDKTAVVCGARPGDEAGAFLLRLEKPLPVEEQRDEPRPWIFELADGATCVALTGTVPSTADETAPWACDDETYILGEPRRGDVWTVRKVLLSDEAMPSIVKRSSIVAVRAVWE